jgi:hypothetical protein
MSPQQTNPKLYCAPQNNLTTIVVKQQHAITKNL